MMRIEKLTLERYRKAKDVVLELDGLTVLIGPNAGGKSNLLDGLRFLWSAAVTGDFRNPVMERGGILQLGWKGETKPQVCLTVIFVRDDGDRFEWRVTLRPTNTDFEVIEKLWRRAPGAGRMVLIENEPRNKWWFNESTGGREERLALDPTACALTAAAANEAFAGREVLDHLKTWVFADPNPGAMRMPCAYDRPSYLDIYGRNLAARVLAIRDAERDRFEQIVHLLADLTGISMRELDVKELDDGRLSLQLHEDGLQYPVNQPSFSSGTLRALALLVAIAGSERVGLLGIEEPENYLHPRALEVLMEELRKAAERGTQVLITSHSPVLLDCLSDRPEVVSVVTGTSAAGTAVTRETSREGVATALRESGFSLGDYHLSMGGFAGVWTA